MSYHPPVGVGDPASSSSFASSLTGLSTHSQPMHTHSAANFAGHQASTIAFAEGTSVGSSASTFAASLAASSNFDTPLPRSGSGSSSHEAYEHDVDEVPYDAEEIAEDCRWHEQRG